MAAKNRIIDGQMLLGAIYGFTNIPPTITELCLGLYCEKNRERMDIDVHHLLQKIAQGEYPNLRRVTFKSFCICPTCQQDIVIYRLEDLQDLLENPKSPIDAFDSSELGLPPEIRYPLWRSAKTSPCPFVWIHPDFYQLEKQLIMLKKKKRLAWALLSAREIPQVGMRSVMRKFPRELVRFLILNI